MAEFKISRLRYRWIGTWAPATDYVRDDIIRFGGKTYACLVGHTSTVNFYDELNSIDAYGNPTPRWDLMSDGYEWKGDWTATTGAPPVPTVYKVGDLVKYGAVVYRCVTGHTANSNGIEIDLVKWTPEAITDNWRQEWTVNTKYVFGDVVKYKGYIYRCVVGHTSSGTALLGLEADSGQWEIVFRTEQWKADWQVATRYAVGDVVKYGGTVYRCINGHNSASTVDLGLEAAQSNWEIVHSGVEYKRLWNIAIRYKVNDLVKYGPNLWICTVDHTSDALIGFDQSQWSLWASGQFYENAWNTLVVYQEGDVVKYGGYSYVCLEQNTGIAPTAGGGSVGGSVGTVNSFTNPAPGEFRITGVGLQSAGFTNGDKIWRLEGGTWTDTNITVIDASTIPASGYMQVSANASPAFASGQTIANQAQTNTGATWELLTVGYRFQGDWSNTQVYFIGDLVRYNGYLYSALRDVTGSNIGTDPSNTITWDLVTSGIQYKDAWFPGEQYRLGDVTLWAGTSYICINQHYSDISNQPNLDTSNIYWNTYILGKDDNVLTYQGDLRTYDDFNNSGTITSDRLAIGESGQILKVSDGSADWTRFGVTEKCYYVGTNGIDNILTHGTTIDTPFRTIRYCADNITGPATIFVKSGIFSEELPIKLPAGVAVVGDELRSTTVQPAFGYETQNMFYVRNGCGIRNLTMQGLTGVLGPALPSGTKRPNAGAYVSLDPGAGPTDSSVWITTKSPYIQNVTTFGTGCVGLKIDGDLHNGGNRSVVANDFTQVLSDGIGVWVRGNARSELVSVFTYYNYMGYLAEDGGKIRATNGNNSYGTYGSAAEGVDAGEIPIIGQINNRTGQATVAQVFTNGSNNLVAFEFGNAGENYTSATYAVTGAGNGASVLNLETRHGAVFEARVIDNPTDGIDAGGSGYVSVFNNAQSGDLTTITIAQSDQNLEVAYLGMRIVITSGTGAGQYGYITDFDFATKIVTVARECDDVLGWESIYPGTPIEPVLDTTTQYTIEPRVTIDDPTYVTAGVTLPVAGLATSIHYGGDRFMMVAAGNQFGAYSVDGETWSTTTLTNPKSWTGLSYGAGTWVMISAGAVPEIAYSTTSATTWNVAPAATVPWNDITYGDGKFVVIGQVSTAGTNASVTYSTTGTTWSDVTIPFGTGGAVAWRVVWGYNKFVAVNDVNGTYYTSPDGVTWTERTQSIITSAIVDVEWGNNRFVMLEETGKTAYSFDGITWYAGDNLASNTWVKLSYGNGVFIAITTGSVAAQSNEGKHWKPRTISCSDTNAIGYGLTANGPRWIAAGLNQAGSIKTGAKAKGRAVITGGRLGSVKLFEPGSGYTATPDYYINDPSHFTDALLNPRIGNGVLGVPYFANRGNDYTNAQATVSGNGYGDIYQTDGSLYLSNVSVLPGPGDNLVIDTTTDVLYSIVAVTNLGGSLGNFSVKVDIFPPTTVANAPAHATHVEIRQRYSQCRLTGHDFLDIGTGNLYDSNYPNTARIDKSPQNETYARLGGRVFYTSTDQDGNFRVGELFKVEQATGIVTLNATYFNLSGLTELRLGGVSLGGTGAVIREFSTDPTLSRNSDNIVPTQKAINAYITSKITSGGSDIATGILTAGVVQVGPNNISTSTQVPINVKVKMNFTGGVDGNMMASSVFNDSFSAYDGNPY